MWSQISRTMLPLAREWRRSCSRCKVPEVSILFLLRLLLIASLQQVQNQMKKSLLARSNNLPLSAIALLWYTMLTLLAKNAALHRANTTKENVRPMIPWPEKGSAGNGFNLQAKMGLADDELYGALQVSYFFFVLHTFLSEDLQHCVWDVVNKAGLDCRIKWYHQPKHLIAQVIGVVCCWLPIFHKFLFTHAPRLENAMTISNDSHMDGQLKHSSSLASRTSTLMHVNMDISKNLVMQMMQGARVMRSL